MTLSILSFPPHLGSSESHTKEHTTESRRNTAKNRHSKSTPEASPPSSQTFPFLSLALLPTHLAKRLPPPSNQLRPLPTAKALPPSSCNEAPRQRLAGDRMMVMKMLLH
jgi:hypothetical protein